MKLSELVEKGWQEHEANTESVAATLEDGLELVEPEDAGGVGAFMNLTIHTIGDHGGDRARALRICEGAFARLSDYGDRQPWLFLAVARFLAGEDEGARAAELELGPEPANQVRVRLLVAQGKVHGGEWQAAQELYENCMAVAESLPAGHAAERAAAIVSNNIASVLVRHESRDEAQDKLMEQAAISARTFWLRVGDWTNDERGDYLLAMVHNSLERGAQARDFALRGLKTIAANGEEKVDQAFLELALAQAYRLIGDPDEQALAIERATALADDFGDKGLVNWFNDELGKAR